MVKAFPSTAHFKEAIIQAFYDGIKHKPERPLQRQGHVLRTKTPISTAGISAA